MIGGVIRFNVPICIATGRHCPDKGPAFHIYKQRFDEHIARPAQMARKMNTGIIKDRTRKYLGQIKP